MITPKKILLRVCPLPEESKQGASVLSHMTNNMGRTSVTHAQHTCASMNCRIEKWPKDMKR